MFAVISNRNSEKNHPWPFFERVRVKEFIEEFLQKFSIGEFLKTYLEEF